MPALVSLLLLPVATAFTEQPQAVQFCDAPADHGEGSGTCLEWPTELDEGDALSLLQRHALATSSVHREGLPAEPTADSTWPTRSDHTESPRNATLPTRAVHRQTLSERPLVIMTQPKTSVQREASETPHINITMDAKSVGVLPELPPMNVQKAPNADSSAQWILNSYPQWRQDSCAAAGISLDKNPLVTLRNSGTLPIGLRPGNSIHVMQACPILFVGATMGGEWCWNFGAQYDSFNALDWTPLHTPEYSCALADISFEKAKP